MIIFNNLEKLGYSKETINKYIDEGRVIVTPTGEHKINDVNLLIYIIKSLYPKYDFLKTCTYIDKKTCDVLTELFRFIYLDQNLLALELSFRIFKEMNIYESALLMGGLDAKISKIKYIYADEIVSKKYSYKSLERKFLIDFIFGDLVQARKRMSSLAFLYSSKTPLPFTVIEHYIKAYEKLTRNRNLINNRTQKVFEGSLMSVINSLLDKGDYLACHKMLEEYYISDVENEFIITYEIYRVLDNMVMRELSKNESRVIKQIDVNANGYNSINEVLKDYSLSSLSLSLVDKMCDEKKLNIDVKIDYLEEYKKHKNNKEYKEAFLDLIKHEKMMHKMSKPCNLYYLMKETTILMENQENDPKEMQQMHDKLLEEASIRKANNLYEEAIYLYTQSFDYEGIRTPLTYAKIAECYMALEDYKKAVEYYNLEYQEYMYPMDFLHYIECLYFINDLDNIFKIADEFELYYPSSSSLVHYILSICYVKMENYKDALNEIDRCENITYDSYELELHYIYEKKILNDLIKGDTSKDLYTLEDYKDHCFNQYDLNRIKSYDIESLAQDGSLLMKVIKEQTDEVLEDKLKFLFSLYRVVVFMKRNRDARDILHYINQLQEHVDLNEEDDKYFTSIIKKL